MLYSIAETRATPVSSLVEPLPIDSRPSYCTELLLNPMVACALLTRTLLYMQYCAVQTSPKHDIPACQSVPGWDGMGWDASFRTVLRTRTAEATCYLHLHVHGMQCSIQGCTCSDVRLLNFVGLLLVRCHATLLIRHIPLVSPSIPHPLLGLNSALICCLSLCCFFVYSG